MADPPELQRSDTAMTFGDLASKMEGEEGDLLLASFRGGEAAEMNQSVRKDATEKSMQEVEGMTQEELTRNAALYLDVVAMVDIRQLMEQHENLNNENDRLKQQIADKADETTSYETTISDLEAKVEASAKQFTEAAEAHQVALHDVNSQITLLETQVRELETLKQQAETSSMNTDASKDEVARKDDFIKGLQEDCKAKTSEILELKHKAQDNEEHMLELDSEIEKLTARMGELAEELEGVRIKHQTLEKEKSEAADTHKANCKDLERQIQQAVQEKEDRSTVVTERDEKLAKLQQTLLERDSKLGEKEDEIITLKEARGKITKQLEAQSAKHREAHEDQAVVYSKDKQEYKNKIEELEKIIKEKENKSRDLKSEAADTENELQERIKDLGHEVKESEAAAQLALENKEHAEKALQTMRDETAERDKKHIKEVQEKATQIEQLKADLALLLEGKKESEQTLKELVQAAEDAQAAAERKEEEAHADLEVAQEKSANSEKEKRDLIAEKEMVESRVTEKQRRMEELEAECRKKLLADKELHHQAMREIEYAKSELQSQLNKTELLKSNLEEHLKDAETQIDMHAATISKLQGNVEKHVRQLEDQQIDEEKRVKEVRIQYEDRIGVQQREYRALELQLDSCKKNEEDLRKIKKENTAGIEDLKARIGDLEREQKLLEDRAFREAQDLKEAAAREQEEYARREAFALEEHLRKVSDLERRVDAHTDELQSQSDKHQEEMRKAQVRFQNELDDTTREASRDKSAAYNEGEEQAEKRATESIKHLEATIEALRKENNQLVLDNEGNEKVRKAVIRSMKDGLEEAKSAHEKQQHEVKEVNKKTIKEITEKFEKCSHEVATEKALKEDTERQLVRARQTAENAKSEYEIRMQGLEMQMADTEKRCKDQIEDERKRKERAEEDMFDAKHKLDKMTKSVTDRELTLDQKCKRFESDMKSAHSEAAVAKAKCESLSIQLQERERALSNAGQRIASMITERASSPSPRRQIAFDDYEKRLSDLKRKAEGSELELERVKMELKKREKELLELEEERRKAVQEVQDIDTKAALLDGEQKKVEKDLREVNGDVERLTRELNEAKQALRMEKLGNESRINDCERENADLRRSFETYKARAGAEVRALKTQHERDTAEIIKSRDLIDATKSKGERDLAQLKRHTLEAKRSVQSGTTELNDLQQEHFMHRSKYDDLRFQLHKAKDELTTLKQRSTQSEQELVLAKDEVDKVSSENMMLQSRLAENSLHAERRDRDNENMVLQIKQETSKETATLRNMLSSKERVQQDGEVVSLRAMNNAARARLRHADVERSDMEKQLKQMENTVEAVGKESYTAKRTAADAETGLVGMRRQVERLKGKSQRLQRGFDDVSSDMRVANGEMVALQTELAGVRKSLFSSDLHARRLAHENELESKRTTYAWEKAREVAARTPSRTLAYPSDDSSNDASFTSEHKLLTSPYRSRPYTPR